MEGGWYIAIIKKISRYPINMCGYINGPVTYRVFRSELPSRYCRNILVTFTGKYDPIELELDTCLIRVYPDTLEIHIIDADISSLDLLARALSGSRVYELSGHLRVNSN